MRAKPIVVVKTGEPVPPVLARRGEFAQLIQEAIGEAWDGGYACFDARTDAPLDPRDAAAFVITGSSANVPDRLPWMLRTEAWLRDVVGAGTPTLGICFGHQLLGQALGGDVQKNPRGREIGTIVVERTSDDPLFAGLEPSFVANATHVDSVVRLPSGATALARSSLDSHQAIRFAPACYGVQFHPEIDAEVMRAYIDARREILVGEGIDADALATAVTEGEPGRRTIKNFLVHVLGR
jgi:GMP synthase (glutamine-hydrolysing)